MKVAVLHDDIPPTARPDELDGLVQVEAICRALADLGHEPCPLQFSLDLRGVAQRLDRLGPDAVVNLVESVEGRGRLVYLAPALLDVLGLPYTGAPTEALFLTANKLLTKRFLQAQGVRTPSWVSGSDVAGAGVAFPGSFIIKSVWEEASVGIEDDSIVAAADCDALRREVTARLGRLGGEAFAESYIDGREFNVSILGQAGGPQVLPPAEIQFLGYPDDKPRIVGYRAKWADDSFEYVHTPRRFDFPGSDARLLDELCGIAQECWRLLGLAGYARVDFRVDRVGRSWVLEVNANPCLSSDAGFVEAAKQAGLRFDEVVIRLLGEAMGRLAMPRTAAVPVTTKEGAS